MGKDIKLHFDIFHAVHDICSTGIAMDVVLSEKKKILFLCLNIENFDTFTAVTLLKIFKGEEVGV